MFVHHDYMYHFIYSRLKHIGKCKHTYHIYKAALQIDPYKMNKIFLKYLQHSTILKRVPFTRSEPDIWIPNPSISMFQSMLPGDIIYRKDKNICYIIPQSKNQDLWHILSETDKHVLDILFSSIYNYSYGLDAILTRVRYIAPFKLPNTPCLQIFCHIRWTVNRIDTLAPTPLSHIIVYIRSLATPIIWSKIQKHISVLQHLITVEKIASEEYYTLTFHQFSETGRCSNGICSIYHYIMKHTNNLIRHGPFITCDNNNSSVIPLLLWPMLIHDIIHHSKTDHIRYMLGTFDHSSIIQEAWSYDQYTTHVKHITLSYNNISYSTSHILGIINVVNRISPFVNGNLHILFRNEHYLKIYKAHRNNNDHACSIIDHNNLDMLSSDILVFVGICYRTVETYVQQNKRCVFVNIIPNNNNMDIHYSIPVTDGGSVLDMSIYLYTTPPMNIPIIPCKTPQYVLEAHKTAGDQWKTNNTIYTCLKYLCVYSDSLIVRLILSWIQHHVQYQYQTYRKLSVVSYVSLQSPLYGIDDVCSICREPFRFPRQLGCRHVFCRLCLSTHIQHSKRCPDCNCFIMNNNSTTNNNNTNDYICTMPFQNYSDVKLFEHQLEDKRISCGLESIVYNTKIDSIISFIKQYASTFFNDSSTTTISLYTHNQLIVDHIQSMLPALTILRLHPMSIIHQNNDNNTTIIIIIDIDSYYPTLLDYHITTRIQIIGIFIYTDTVEIFNITNPFS